MRFINTTTLNLEWFGEWSLPEYAILSHTWGQDEVQFSDMNDVQQAMSKPGFSKIHNACKIARELEYRYLWIDAICIDQSSSAEHCEAIISMFRWYRNADICLAYLSDAQGQALEEIKNCRWFTRCWTLQELIAPARLSFYNKTWQYIGDKSTPEVLHLISSITGVDEDVLEDAELLSSRPICHRMAWAADRTCARREDVAYSLLGIFDVNILPLYGEGDRAFGRLQEEIIRRSSDHSLLAWTTEGIEPYHGIFAKSPSGFRIFRHNHLSIVKDFGDRTEYWMVNGNLRFGGKVFAQHHWSLSNYILDLGFLQQRGAILWRVGILLKMSLGTFVRAMPQRLYRVGTKDGGTFMTKTLDLRASLSVFETKSLQYLPGNVKDINESVSSVKDKRPSQKSASSAANGYSRNFERNNIAEHSLDLLSDHDQVSVDPSQWLCSHSEPTAWSGQHFQIRAGGANRMSITDAFQTPWWDLGQPFYSKNDHTTINHERRSLGEDSSDDADSLQSSASSNSDVLFDSQARGSGPRFRIGKIRLGKRVTLPRHLLEPQPSWSLACPLYLHNRSEHDQCLQGILPDISALQQHLVIVHTQHPHCPICGRTFPGVRQRDIHIVSSSCQPTEQGSGSTKGMTAEQHQRLKESGLMTTDGGDLASQWRRIWDALFPGRSYPSSIFVLNTKRSRSSRVLLTCETAWEDRCHFIDRQD